MGKYYGQHPSAVRLLCFICVCGFVHVVKYKQELFRSMVYDKLHLVIKF